MISLLRIRILGATHTVPLVTHRHSRRRRWLLLAVPPWVLALSYPPLLFDKAQPCAQCAL